MPSNNPLTRRRLLTGLGATACAPLLLADLGGRASAQTGPMGVIRHARGGRIPTRFRNNVQLRNVASAALENRFSSVPGLRATPGWAHHGFNPTNPPARFDWRNHNAVTPVRNQGQCGSCFIFASLAAYESAYLIANHGTDPSRLEVSQQQLLDCGLAEETCDTGGWHEFVLTYLQKLGAVGSSSYPYNSQQAQRGAQCRSNWGRQRPFFLRNWGYVSDGSDVPPVAGLKRAILARGPVVCGVAAVQDKSALDWDSYKGGVINAFPSEQNLFGVDHEVVIVGWDDSLRGNGFPPGAWIVKNSWDTTWGEQGYVKIPYNGNHIGFGASWISAWSANSRATFDSLSSQLMGRP